MNQPTKHKPARVLVVGGRGFLGHRVVRALEPVTDVDVKAGSRRTESGDVRIDLSVPDTFAAADVCSKALRPSRTSPSRSRSTRCRVPGRARSR